MDQALRELVPFAVRHGTAIWASAIPLLFAVSVSLAHRSLRARLGRRAKEALADLDKPDPEAGEALDGALVAVKGRLAAERGGKPVAAGEPLLSSVGDAVVSGDGPMLLERRHGRVALVGPHRILVGSREGFPVGKGRRVLCSGDDVVVSGRFASGAPGDSTYRAASPIASIVPAGNELELAAARPPQPMALRRRALAIGSAAAVAVWVLSFVGGALWARSAALAAIDAEERRFTLASLACASPVTRGSAKKLLLDTASRWVPRDDGLAERWAAAESFFDEAGDCLGALENRHHDGRIEEEARLGVLCGGPGSKRRAAQALLLLGEFAEAAELLRAAPPLDAPREGAPDVRLDIRAALFTGDLAGAAALIRRHGHPKLTAEMQNCVALGLEARAGNAAARVELRARASGHWTCKLLHADLLDGAERIAFLDTLDQPLLQRIPGRFFALLGEEADPRRVSGWMAYRLPELPPLLGAPSRDEGLDPLRAVRASTLVRMNAMAEVSKPYRRTRAFVAIEHAMFAVHVGDDAEGLRLVERAMADYEQSMSAEDEWDPYICQMRLFAATLTFRIGDPKAESYLRAATDDKKNHCDVQWVRGAFAVRAGEGGGAAYYASTNATEQLADAIIRGQAADVLAASQEDMLLSHLVVAAPRIESGHYAVIERLRWYEPACDSATCHLEFLASQAAVRALVFSRLGAHEEAFIMAERARNLRGPLSRRDISLAMALVENPTPLEWW